MCKITVRATVMHCYGNTVIYLLPWGISFMWNFNGKNLKVISFDAGYKYIFIYNFLMYILSQVQVDKQMV